MGRFVCPSVSLSRLSTETKPLVSLGNSETTIVVWGVCQLDCDILGGFKILRPSTENIMCVRILV